MFNCKKRLTSLFLVLLILTSFMAYIVYHMASLEVRLLPAKQSSLTWRAFTISDREQGGSSKITLHESEHLLDYSFLATESHKIDYPYATLILSFVDTGNADRPVNLARYTDLSFAIRCKPQNELTLALYTYDKHVTDLSDSSSYRIPSAYIQCEDRWADVEIDMTGLEVPKWWLLLNGLELSDKGYGLNQVYSFNFVITSQSPLNTLSNVKIDELALAGFDRRYIYIYSIVMVLVWGAFIVLLLKRMLPCSVAQRIGKTDIDKSHADDYQPGNAPEKEPKTDVLKFIEEEYSNPELCLNLVSKKFGISRGKINEILKREDGVTFSSYMNKLRLIEAARLLQEVHEANVAEIAGRVGYNNPSYFNRRFKKTYGCTPSEFRDRFQQKKT